MTVLHDAAARPGVARSQLLLLINETVYRVHPVRCEPPDEVRAFRLNKPDGTLYDVAQTRFGPQCDCPDFIFRRDGLDPAGCKHVQALVAGGLIEGTPRSPGRVVDRGDRPA